MEESYMIANMETEFIAIDSTMVAVNNVDTVVRGDTQEYDMVNNVETILAFTGTESERTGSTISSMNAFTSMETSGGCVSDTTIIQSGNTTIAASQHLSRDLMTDSYLIRGQMQFNVKQDKMNSMDQSLAQHIRYTALTEAESSRQRIFAQNQRLGRVYRVPTNNKCMYKFEASEYFRKMEKKCAEYYHLVQLHKSDERLQYEYRRVLQEVSILRKEKTTHIERSQLCLKEEESPFASRPVLAHRYVLIKLLGRGGFCEVWKVYDMVEKVEFAAKFHSSQSQARNEHGIQHKLKHPNIVQVHDELIVGEGIFAGYYIMIMELVDSSLAHQLKNYRFSEQESRSIIAQIMDALAYLNASPHAHLRIVHYDLKPENILLTESGRVKITDFGLSMHEQPALPLHGICGTFWYLPPECFKLHSTLNMCSKIDTWSVGILFYQLLFGKRPYGEGMTQQSILSNHVILNATQITFPKTCTISNESLQFITNCLQPNPLYRPNIRQLCQM